MDKLISLAREAGIDWLIANYDMEPQLHTFYTLARADLESEIFRLREHIIDQTKLEQEIAQLLAANRDCMDHYNELRAENAKLRFALDAVYRTCDWHGDDGREAMQAARAALGETK